MNKEIIIFTDGSSSGNPGPGGWAAIIALPNNTVQELGGKESHTTNNRMEMTAALKALHYIKDIERDVIIHTDSSYLIQGITKWVKGWVKNNWITSTKTEVINRDIWEELIACLARREEMGSVTWKHIAGHSGIPGNERVDEIATAYTFDKPITLFSGSRSDYSVDIFSLTPNRVKKEIKDAKRSRSKTPAYSYISVVEGLVKTHSTWAECEARVKGKRGVKFKKVFSADEEQSLIQEWS